MAALRERLTGIDAARGLALLGMFATHLLPLHGPGPEEPPSWVGLLLSGRPGALFAVLAGIGLALASGRETPPAGTGLNAARRAAAGRAAVVLAVGLALGATGAPVAIILLSYAALYLCMTPFLGLPPRWVLLWATGWTVLSPVAGYLLRPLAAGLAGTRSLPSAATWNILVDQPLLVLQDTFLTGSFPVLQWMSYLLIGLALGRLPLRRAGVQVSMLLGGALATFAAPQVAGFLLGTLGGGRALLASPQAASVPLPSRLAVDLSGVDQAGSWWWLATAAPHSGTTLDLVRTAGSAAAVVGLCLLLTRVHPRLLLPLSGAGAIPLTLYSAYVLALAAGSAGPASGWPPVRVLAAYAFCALAAGTVLAVLRWRGPLELAAHGAAAVAGWRREPAGVRDGRRTAVRLPG